VWGSDKEAVGGAEGLEGIRGTDPDIPRPWKVKKKRGVKLVVATPDGSPGRATAATTATVTTAATATAATAAETC
jgi:hypothetical protein